IAMNITSFLTLYSAGVNTWTYVVPAILGAVFALQVREPDKNSGKIFQGSITYLSLYSILLVVAVFI
ncbi:MAG: protoheme IX farnesyltransferase, partial [Actinomycetota bacterium]